MYTSLQFHDLLEPFSASVKQEISLPEAVSKEVFIELFQKFFNLTDLKMHAEPLHSASHLPQHQNLLMLRLDPIQAPFYIAIAAPCKAKLFELFFQSKDPFQDERLSQASLGYLATKYLDLFNQNQPLPKMSAYLTQGTSFPDAYQHLKIEVIIPHSYPLVFDIYFTETFVEAFQKFFHGNFEKKRLNVPLLVRLNTGLVRLSANQFRQAKLQDLIILDENYYQLDSHKGIANLVVKTIPFAQVRITGHTLKFLDFNTLPEEAFMEQQIESSLKQISDVKLDLHVEFATIKVHLKDLENLSTGQTIEFTKDHPAQCYLTLHGQRVAKGELVKVGEQMAFLVQEIHHG